MSSVAASTDERPSTANMMRQARSHRGATLETLSRQSPLLVVFLRHFGCVFCRETLATLSKQRSVIEAHGLQIALVHMSKPMDASRLVDEYGLYDLHRFSDPDCQIYRSFSIRRGSLRQIFNWQTIGKAMSAIYRGFLPGRLRGDALRLPGAIVLRHGQIIRSFTAATAADRPDFARIAAEFSMPKNVFERTDDTRLRTAG